MDTKSLIVGMVLGAGLSLSIAHVLWSYKRARVIAEVKATFGEHIPPIPSNAVIVPGEKGKNGAGDGGPGIFWPDGFVVLPGRPGKGDAR
jgi:hypothetical protein